MSFRDDYKKEFGSISPDSDKIIEGVHERLNENAPIKIRIVRKKRSVFVYIGSFAGAAACLALFMTVLFVVAPNFVKKDSAATNEGTNGEDTYLIGGNPAAPDNAYNGDGTADEADRNEINKPNEGIWNSSEVVLSDNANKAEGTDYESIELKIIGSSISDARKVIFNGEEYYKTTAVKKEFDEIPERLSVIRVSDEVYYVLVDGDRIYFAENEWDVNEKPYCFARIWSVGSSEYSFSMGR